MSAPFGYPGIKGTTAGAPGSSAFTPNAAASGGRAWSNVPTGWIGLVRFEDGTSWELSFCYWNGTTLSRGTNQLFDSSSGSVLSLTSAATAALVGDPSEVMAHLGTTPFAWSCVQAGTTNVSSVGWGGPTKTGAAASVSLSNSYLGVQRRETDTSLTTASAQCGWSTATTQWLYSTTAGVGGGELVVRFAASGLPTGPRLFVGMTAATFVGQTIEPSAFTAHFAAFTLDSTDSNVQFTTNSNVGAGTKTDTGIPLVANGLYETSIWYEPGGGKFYGLLIRLDTGAIWYGSVTADIPANGTSLFPQVLGGLNGTNTGTAFVMNMMGMSIKQGF